jgi:glycosyltransferase involved in cell wall biosynthesis
MTDSDLKPLVSVIVPAYNRAATIGSTLDSITCQKGWPFEILVIDDGSSDDTAAIARRHAPQARVIVQANQRRSAARNNGAKLARGEFLYFFDSDDLMEPDAIARLAGCLTDHPNAAVAYGSALQFVDDPAAAVPRLPACDKSGDLLGTHLERPFLIPVMAMVRREWYERVGGMTTLLDYCEDYHFFLKLSALGAEYRCIGGAPVVRYREYPVQRLPGSIHMQGFVTALRMIAEEHGDRIPPDTRLEYYMARSRAAYARHLLREKQTRKAWSTWLSSLGGYRREVFRDSLIFLGSLVFPVRLLERFVYGGPRRMRDAWGWCLHQFGVGMKSVKTP